MKEPKLSFYGGTAGALAPFALFIAGVAWLALSGAPDERGFWPILLAALSLGLVVARDRTAYAEATVRGMSQPIVMLMIMAWLLAGVFGTLMNASGFIESLVWIAGRVGLSGGGYVAAAFLVCAVVSTATGTSLGTILVCGPLLYPAGGSLGSEPAVLIGAILGGATFGDNISPVSDTTIASASTQGADIGGVVRSRLIYALPAAGLALAAALILGGADGPGTGIEIGGTPNGLPMLLAPIVVISLLLRRRHLLEGLLWGLIAATAVGLGFGLFGPTDLMGIDAKNFVARGLLLDGINRGIGVSVFTLLLMGLVGTIEATGLLDTLVESARRKARSARDAELRIFATISAVVLLLTHSAVAILIVGKFTKETGAAFGISPYRRANILDVTVCTYPFLLPFMIPTILAASLTQAGIESGMPRITPFVAGMYNVHSWALLGIIVASVVVGWPRERGGPKETT